jgi:hypothetical protein
MNIKDNVDSLPISVCTIKNTKRRGRERVDGKMARSEPVRQTVIISLLLL